MPSIVSRIGKIDDPQKWFNAQIYPSWRWMKLGARPTLNKIKSAKKKIEDCFAESLKLSYEKKRTTLLVL